MNIVIITIVVVTVVVVSAIFLVVSISIRILASIHLRSPYLK